MGCVMVEIRINTTKDELEQILGILKATDGIEIISISKDYPNRGFDSRVRSYIKCELKEKKPADYLSDSSFSNFEDLPNVNNSEDEVLEYMKDAKEHDPQSLNSDEMFFSTFCVNCKYLEQQNINKSFRCLKDCREFELKSFDKNRCPIYNNLIKGEPKECM